VAKNASILGPLVGFKRGAILPYFGKQGDLKAYFSQGAIMKDLRAFPELFGIPEMQKEPV
jgi:hypothetical protein